MKIPISDRLLACAGFINKGDRIADIGCDHGYLSIWLLTQGIAVSAIAADINQGPLDSAKRNAAKYGVENKIRFYLSDGVQAIDHDFDTLVCAGMGADTMISIFEAAPWLKSSAYRMVLQCQSKTPMLRKYLSVSGWCITKETVLRDGRFLYTVMEACYQPERCALTEAECYFSPALLNNSTPETAEYLNWVIGGLELSIRHDPEKRSILNELKKLAEESL